MKPVDQVCLHNPEENVAGDCFRAVIASLLELPIERVPHFSHDYFTNPDKTIWIERLQDFLAGFGYFYIQYSWNETSMKKWMEESRISSPIYHEICDISPRFPTVCHSVVGCNGVVVHDPHPSKLGLPNVTSERVFGFLMKL